MRLSDKINDAYIEWKMFSPNASARSESRLCHESCIRSGYRSETPTRRDLDESIRQPSFFFFLSNDTLHLFVHHTREFASANVPPTTIQTIMWHLDTVQCAYTIYTKALACSHRPISVLSLSFSHARARSLALSFFPSFFLSAAKIGTVFYAVSKFTVFRLLKYNRFKLAIIYLRDSTLVLVRYPEFELVSAHTVFYDRSVWLHFILSSSLSSVSVFPLPAYTYTYIYQAHFSFSSRVRYYVLPFIFASLIRGQ